MKRSLFAELRRRNVFRAGAFYIAATWALAQGISQLGPAIGLPDWTTRWFLVAAVVAFPFWLAFAWFYEFTPEGLKRESEIDPAQSITAHTGKKLDRWIFAIMGIAIVLLVTDRFVLRHGVNEEASIAAPAMSLAVLPFANLSSDKEQEYFADGISEELLNLLAKAQPLQVAARTSSFSFKGKQVGIAEIAKVLHVANVLEGSVRKAGDAVRISAQLIRAGDGYEIWSQSWDRKLDDIFAIQDQIAADVAKQLKVTLLGPTPKARPTDPRAYAFYLQANQLARQFTATAFEQSNALYRKVLAIDPRYAPAWNGLAGNFCNEINMGLLSVEAGFAQCREAANKALEIDTEYAPAHARLGFIAMNRDNDLAGAAQHLERALALDATNSGVITDSASLVESLGRLDEALALHEAFFRRDPVNVQVLYALGLAQRWAGRFDAAIASFRTVLSLAPGRGGAHNNLGVALLLKGDAQGALSEIQQETSEVWKMIGLPLAYHALGRKVDSDAALAALIGKYGKDAAGNIAYVYAFRGEADNAFSWLDKELEYNGPSMSEIVVENLFDNIHADPRWLPFLRKLGKAPEQLAKIEFKVVLPQAEGSATSSGANH